MKKLISLIILVMLFSRVDAQPFLLRSTGLAKPFHLDIYYGTEGKGAFVQYRGQQGLIPLKLKSRVLQAHAKDNTGTAKITYVWDELVGGKVTGSYGLTHEAEILSKIWYTRNKDGKQFSLENSPAQEGGDGKDKYLLHGTLIKFYHSTNDMLSFSYPDGSSQNLELPEFDLPDPARQGIIADYNFDGYDDVAFSFPDAGMGVYRTFSIYLYNPKSKRFQLLAEPNDSKANCSGFCDVTLDKKNKLLMTSCRGAATWWKDAYRFSQGNKLLWLRSIRSQ